VPVIVNSNLTVSGGLSINNLNVSGTISGNGSGLTSLNASNITSGTLADAYLSSNVALKNAANTFTANQTVNGGSSSSLRLVSSTSSELWFNSTGQPVDNRLWIFLNSGTSLQLRVYDDAASSSKVAINFLRSGTTPGQINTYGNLYVGAELSNNGYMGVITGGASLSGSAQFFSPSGVRVGYIGGASTFGTGDNGTLPYVAGNHNFVGDVTVNTGAVSILTLRASGSPQLRLENTAAAANNRNWIVYADAASLQIRPYSDDYSSNTAALSIARSGTTAGAIQTYGNLYAGANQSGNGYVGIQTGGGSASGYTAFYSPSGTRVGYIGFATTFGTGDNGTIPYFAGAHEFTGRANTVPVSVAFSATPTFNSAQSNTIYFGTMTANVTSMTISNPVDGAQLQIRFVQDGTGGRTVTLPSNVQVSGSLNTAANAVTWLVITYVSSASRWEGTWTRVS
jgi:hypothetical protein